uniref:Pre-mRNA-splicing factor SPF27 n=1 Tax=Rhabditophanes sp. KR3021 TaxID=114890 RepID=A0AC35TKD6_9BILA
MSTLSALIKEKDAQDNDEDSNNGESSRKTENMDIDDAGSSDRSSESTDPPPYVPPDFATRDYLKVLGNTLNAPPKPQPPGDTRMNDPRDSYHPIRGQLNKMMKRYDNEGAKSGLLGKAIDNVGIQLQSIVHSLQITAGPNSNNMDLDIKETAEFVTKQWKDSILNAQGEFNRVSLMWTLQDPNEANKSRIDDLNNGIARQRILLNNSNQTIQDIVSRKQSAKAKEMSKSKTTESSKNIQT